MTSLEEFRREVHPDLWRCSAVMYDALDAPRCVREFGHDLLDLVGPGRPHSGLAPLSTGEWGVVEWLSTWTYDRRESDR